MNDIAVGVEHFDKAAHVGAFELFGQIHEHPDRGNGILHGTRLVADLDGKSQAADAYFVDAQIAVVALALLVVQLGAGPAKRPS